MRRSGTSVRGDASRASPLPLFYIGLSVFGEQTAVDRYSTWRVHEALHLRNRP